MMSLYMLSFPYSLDLIRNSSWNIRYEVDLDVCQGFFIETGLRTLSSMEADLEHLTRSFLRATTIPNLYT